MPVMTSTQNNTRIDADLLLDGSVSILPEVGEVITRDLQRRGIYTLRDLLCTFPRRYVDMSNIKLINGANIGDEFTLIGTVYEVKSKQPRPYLNLVEVTVQDQSGVMIATFFRQPWIPKKLKSGMTVAISGKMEFNYGYKRMTNPYFEVIDSSNDVDSGLMLAIHPASAKTTSQTMRRIMASALEMTAKASDPLPLSLRTKYRLMSYARALACVHFPRNNNEMIAAKRRLIYQEVLTMQLYLMAEAYAGPNGNKGFAHSVKGATVQKLVANLPFNLTEEQLAAKDDILSEMSSEKRACHLLLGDVGTGKTVVSAFALAAVKDSGTSAAFLVPTDVLARQHCDALGPLLESIGISWDILCGSTSKKNREDILSRLDAGQIDVLFGTHALLEPDVVFKELSCVIIDEQQRFGVNQRDKMLAKSKCCDLISLSATPIPRSLAISLYGHMTLSYIKNRPCNFAGNTTKVYTYDNRGRAFDAAKQALSNGRQVYIVCPLVGEGKFISNQESLDSQATPVNLSDHEESYEYAFENINIESNEDMESMQAGLRSAKTEAKILQEQVFTNFKVGLLHGKMTAEEKHEVMEDFRSEKLQVLVATTIIEVGVDVPNASVMIIQDADRFGLSQLHQLRGRVGRGKESGEVYLISSTKNPVALSRLNAMENCQDGFEIANIDLSLRREGDIVGSRQHGASSLKLVNVVRDFKIIETANKDAREIIEKDPSLELAENKAIAREVHREFSNDKQSTLS